MGFLSSPSIIKPRKPEKQRISCCSKSTSGQNIAIKSSTVVLSRCKSWGGVFWGKTLWSFLVYTWKGWHTEGDMPELLSSLKQYAERMQCTLLPFNENGVESLTQMGFLPANFWLRHESGWVSFHRCCHSR